MFFIRCIGLLYDMIACNVIWSDERCAACSQGKPVFGLQEKQHEIFVQIRNSLIACNTRKTTTTPWILHTNTFYGNHLYCEKTFGYGILRLTFTFCWFWCAVYRELHHNDDVRKVPLRKTLETAFLRILICLCNQGEFYCLFFRRGTFLFKTL